MIRNANGDVLHVTPCKIVPVRRGTGPKASIKKFLAAYDAWCKYRHDNDPNEWGDEELEEDDRLYEAMQAARAEVKGVMGAV
jgi:hypothetical protein